MRQGLHDMEENEIYRPLPSKWFRPSKRTRKQRLLAITPLAKTTNYH